MGGEFLCKEIKLDFSQSSYIPENITGWTTDGNRKNKYDNIFSISGNSSSKLAIPLNKAFAFMILTTSAFNRNPAVAATMALHPEIDFFLNEQQQKNYLQDQELHKKILIAGNDQRNPLYVFRWPITEYYRHVAAQLLGKDADKLSDFQKVITLMDYICKLSYLPPHDVTPFGVLHEKMAECSSYSATLIALAATCGIRGRYVNLHNYPVNNGHTVTEMFLNGKWRIFDPTYGVYFKDAKTGEIMSFEELRNPVNKAVPVYQNRERYAESGKSWGTQTVYLQANPAGPIGPDKPMLFPLKLDLKHKARLEPPTPALQGASYLGAGTTNNNWLWTLSGLTVGKDYEFILTPSFIGGDLDLGEFEFRCRVFGPEKREAENLSIKIQTADLHPIKIRFTAAAPEMTLEFTHPYREMKFHYLSIKQFELVEK